MGEKIHVDFNTMDQDIWSEEARVRIHWSDVTPLFESGLRVTVHDSELAVEATLEWDQEHGIWWARPDWSTKRDLLEP